MKFHFILRNKGKLTKIRLHCIISHLCITPDELLSTLKRLLSVKRGGGGGLAQSVQSATTGKGVPDSIPAVAARSLLVGSVSV